MEQDLVMKDSVGETSGLQFAPTCWEGHTLKLGQNSEESVGYICNGCRVSSINSLTYTSIPWNTLASLESILESESANAMWHKTQMRKSPGTPVWRCDEDPRRGGRGTCDFDLCVGCIEVYGVRDFGFTKTLFILQVEYFAAWPVLKKLACMMRDLYGRMIQPVLTEEDFEKFRRTIEAISPQMVRGGGW